MMSLISFYNPVLAFMFASYKHSYLIPSAYVLLYVVDLHILGSPLSSDDYHMTGLFMFIPIFISYAGVCLAHEQIHPDFRWVGNRAFRKFLYHVHRSIRPPEPCLS